MAAGIIREEMRLAPIFKTLFADNEICQALTVEEIAGLMHFDEEDSRLEIENLIKHLNINQVDAFEVLSKSLARSLIDTNKENENYKIQLVDEVIYIQERSRLGDYITRLQWRSIFLGHDCSFDIAAELRDLTSTEVDYALSGGNILEVCDRNDKIAENNLKLAFCYGAKLPGINLSGNDQTKDWCAINCDIRLAPIVDFVSANIFTETVRALFDSSLYKSMPPQAFKGFVEVLGQVCGRSLQSGLSDQEDDVLVFFPDDEEQVLEVILPGVADMSEEKLRDYKMANNKKLMQDFVSFNKMKEKLPKGMSKGANKMRQAKANQKDSSSAGLVHGRSQTQSSRYILEKTEETFSQAGSPPLASLSYIGARGNKADLQRCAESWIANNNIAGANIVLMPLGATLGIIPESSLPLKTINMNTGFYKPWIRYLQSIELALNILSDNIEYWRTVLSDGAFVHLFYNEIIGPLFRHIQNFENTIAHSTTKIRQEELDTFLKRHAARIGTFKLLLARISVNVGEKAAEAKSIKYLATFFRITDLEWASHTKKRIQERETASTIGILDDVRRIQHTMEALHLKFGDESIATTKTRDLFQKPLIALAGYIHTKLRNHEFDADIRKGLIFGQITTNDPLRDFLEIMDPSEEKKSITDAIESCRALYLGSHMRGLKKCTIAEIKQVHEFLENVKPADSKLIPKMQLLIYRALQTQIGTPQKHLTTTLEMFPAMSLCGISENLLAAATTYEMKIGELWPLPTDVIGCCIVDYLKYLMNDNNLSVKWDAKEKMQIFGEIARGILLTLMNTSWAAIMPYLVREVMPVHKELRNMSEFFGNLLILLSLLKPSDADTLVGEMTKTMFEFFRDQFSTVVVAGALQRNFAEQIEGLTAAKSVAEWKQALGKWTAELPSSVQSSP